MATQKKEFSKQNIKEAIGKLLGGCLGIILLGAGIGYMMNREKEAWTGFLYPDAAQTESTEIYQKNLKSLEKCREWAQEQADDLDLAEGVWDYECGTGCDFYSAAETSQDRLNNIDRYTCAERTK